MEGISRHHRAPRARLLALEVLRHAARMMRSAGLGAVVEAVKRRIRPVASDFTLDVRGLTMRGSSIGQLGQLRDWADGSKDGYMTDVFEDSLRPGMVAIDVGAYLGYFTLLAARRVGQTGRVVAFEPHPDSRCALCENLADNGFADRVVVVGKAIAATPGRRTFFLDGADESESGLDRTGRPARAIRVDCAQGDEALAAGDVLGARRVDVVKIDVEGREIDVLDSLRGTLTTCRPALFVECNPGALGRAGASAERLLETIAELGLTAHVIDEDARSLRPVTGDLPTRIEPGGYVNLLCSASSGPGAA